MPRQPKQDITDINAIVQQAVMAAMANATSQNEDAVIAAKVNEKYKYSVIVGEYHSGNIHNIAERIKRKEDARPYRLKTVKYVFSSSKQELDEYCKENKVKLTEYSELSEYESKAAPTKSK